MFKITQKRIKEWRFSALPQHQPTKVEEDTITYFDEVPYVVTGSGFQIFRIEGTDEVESVYVRLGEYTIEKID